LYTNRESINHEPCILRVLGSVVVVAFQITFRAEMHANDVFSFFKNHFWHQHIKTIQNLQTILNFSKKKKKNPNAFLMFEVLVRIFYSYPTIFLMCSSNNTNIQITWIPKATRKELSWPTSTKASHHTTGPSPQSVIHRDFWALHNYIKYQHIALWRLSRDELSLFEPWSAP